MDVFGCQFRRIFLCFSKIDDSILTNLGRFLVVFGSIKKGKMADLILLNRNPLQDISNTLEIHGVLINRVFYDTQKLEELKIFTASQASSFHMNIKTLFSLFNSPLIRVQFAD